MAVSVDGHRGDETELVLEDPPVVLLAQQPVEIQQCLLMLVGDGKHGLGHFLQVGVQRPDRGGAFQCALHFLDVAAQCCITRFCQVHVRGRLGCFDQGHGFGHVVVRREGCGFIGMRPGQFEIARPHGGLEPPDFLAELENPPFFLPWQGSNLGKVLAERIGLRETPCRIGDLVVLQQEEVGFHAFFNFAHDLIGQGVEGCHRRRHARALGEELLAAAALLQLEGRISVGEEGPVESRRNLHVFEPSLEKQLNHQHLEFHLGLEL